MQEIRDLSAEYIPNSCILRLPAFTYGGSHQEKIRVYT